MNGKVTKKRSAAELFFAALGALVLMSTFVFKEVLLEPLKDAMNKSSAAISAFEEGSNLVRIADEVHAMRAPQDMSAPEGFYGEHYLQRQIILWAATGLGSLRSELGKRLEDGLSKQVIYASSLKDLSDRNEHIQSTLENCHSSLSEKGDFISDERQMKDLEDEVKKCVGDIQVQFGKTLGQTVEFKGQVEAHEWTVAFYTYVTWTLFGVGLTLAVIGKIFHIPGMDSVAGGE